MATIGDLVVNLTANSSQFQRNMGASQRTVKSFAKVAARAMAATAAAFASVVTITESLKQAAQIESLSVQFEVLLGSASKARDLLADIRKFGASTPFQTDDIANSAKQLLNAGIAADNIIPTLRMLGDLAAAGGKNLGDVAFVISQVRSAGVLMGQDLNQLLNANIPIIAALATEFGVAEGEVKKLVSTGAVTFDRLESALQRLTGEGGKLNGMTQKLSQTTGGLWSTLKDNVNLALAEVGQMVITSLDLKGGMTQVADVISGKVIPYLKEMFDEGKPLIDFMVELGKIGMKVGMELAEIFGEQLLTALKLLKPVFEFVLDSLREIISSTKELTDSISSLLAKLPGQKKQGGGGFGLGEFIQNLGEQNVGANPFSLLPAGGGASGDGGAVPGSVPDQILKSVQKQTDAISGFTDVGGLGLAGDVAAATAEQAEKRETQFAGAATAGSSEAFSSLVRNVFGGGKSEGAKTAENTKKMVELQSENNQLLKGTFSNTATVESF